MDRSGVIMRSGKYGKQVDNENCDRSMVMRSVPTVVLSSVIFAIFTHHSKMDMAVHALCSFFYHLSGLHQQVNCRLINLAHCRWLLWRPKIARPSVGETMRSTFPDARGFSIVTSKWVKVGERQSSRQINIPNNRKILVPRFSTCPLPNDNPWGSDIYCFVSLHRPAYMSQGKHSGLWKSRGIFPGFQRNAADDYVIWRTRPNTLALNSP